MPSAAHEGIQVEEQPSRQEVTAAAYRRVRDLIVSGRLAPGAPLIETELSKRLGVSRTPVRAALQRLQQEGFVAATEAGQLARAFVAPLTAGDMQEVFLMVGALEGTAARLAAGLDEGSRTVLCERLARLDAELTAAAGKRPPELPLAHSAHVGFHRAIAEAAAGPRLLAELDVLQSQAERYERVYTGAILYALEDGAMEHGPILSALESGDGDAAERAVAAGWRACAERYGRVVTILGERGSW